VLSVVNGFQKEFRERILAAAAHVQVSGPEGWLEGWPALAQRLARLPGVVAAAPYIDAQVMLSSGSLARGALVRGIVPALDAQVTDVDRMLTEGSLQALVPGQFNVLLGAELGRSLELSRGDRLSLVLPRGSETGAAAAPALHDLTVGGFIRLGLYEYDSTLALMALEDVAGLTGAGERVSGIRLRLADPGRAGKVALAVSEALPGAVVTDWTRSNRNMFRAVQASKTMLVIILSLIVAVAAFNIVATLILAVMDKEPDIAILRTLGATPGAVLRIFMVQGALIGLLGTLAGAVLGVLGALNASAAVKAVEALGGFHFLAPEIYHISDLPASLQAGDVILTVLTALALSFLATLYPSWRAARVRPAEILRYE
jgi:lipoprotein-releasing system permease protein